MPKKLLILFVFLFTLFSQQKIYAAVTAQISPKGKVETVSQIQIRFSSAMIPMGKLNASSPVLNSCSQNTSGRWLDIKTYVIDYLSPLAPNSKCVVQTVAGLKSLSGQLVDKTSEDFETELAQITRIIPDEGSTIDPEQAFVLVLNGKVSPQWVVSNIYFTFPSRGEKIPVKIIEGSDRKKIIENAVKQNSWRKEEFKDDSLILVLKSDRVFPYSENNQTNAAKMYLHWSKDFEFQIKQSFRATMTCTRENSNSHCLPLYPIDLVFTEPISNESLSQVYLQSPDGVRQNAKLRNNLKIDSSTSISFKGPFAANSEYLVVFPQDLLSTDGDKLTNQNMFPMKVRTDDLPPLMKFTADFGVLESANSKDDEVMLPMTIRHVEPSILALSQSVQSKNIYQVNGSERVLQANEFKKIIQLLNQISNKQDGQALNASLANKIEIKRSLKSADMETIGVPLKGKGLHIVQIASPILGKHLLSTDGKSDNIYYVKSAALVTNLGLTMKYTETLALVFVTELATAKPVVGAKVFIYDPDGINVSQGVTDQEGMVALPRPKIKKEQPSESDVESADQSRGPYNYGFFAVASKGDDFSFVHSSFSKGIESWRYQLPFSRWQDDPPYIGHVIFERNLLRPTEVLRLKGLLRQQSLLGLEFPSEHWPLTVNLVHQSGQPSFSLPIQWNKKNGSFHLDWQVPAGARLGEYEVHFVNEKDTLVNLHNVGTFHVEQFKLPTFESSWSAKDWVQSTEHQVQFRIQYLNGGGASGMPVRMRYEVDKGSVDIKDPDDRDYRWLMGGVSEGIFKEDDLNESKDLPQSGQKDFILDKTGSSIFDLGNLKYKKTLQFAKVFAEYRDANGETKVSGRSYPLWPSSVLVGVKSSSYVFSGEPIVIDVKTMDLQQKISSLIDVDIELFEENFFSSRKKMLGGFYSFDDFKQIKKIKTVCHGKTNDKGLLRCQLNSEGLHGSYTAVVTAKDDKGRSVQSHSYVGVWGQDYWSGSTNNDRVDLIPDQKQYEPGQVAEFIFRTPFETSTVLLTVEREKVLEKKIITLSSKDPIIRLKIKPEWTPNVVVSAVAIRGRLPAKKTNTGDHSVVESSAVDFAKPAYKMGLAAIRIGMQQHQLKVLVKTNKEIYQTREMVTADVELKLPNGNVTDGEIAVAVVDEALLALLDNDSWDVLETMIKQRPYLVETASLQSLIVGKRHFGLKALPAGGDGRGSGLTRELLETSLFWNPSVPVINGHAQVRFSMNDSLSRFRIVAIATSGAQRFGKGWTAIRSHRDIQIYSGLSQAVRQGDSIDAEFTVRNASAVDKKMIAKLSVANIPMKEIVFEIPAGKASILNWPIKIGNSERLFYKVDVVEQSNNKILDSLKVEQKVFPLWKERVLTSQLQQFSGKVNTEISSIAGASRALISASASSSLLGDNLGMKKFWQNYLWNCIEQQISRWVSLNDKVGFDKLMATVNTYQDSDGLLKFFPRMNNGSLILTQTILEMLSEIGWHLPKDVEEKSLSALEDHVRGLLRNSDLNYLGLNQKQDVLLRTLAVLSRYHRLDAQAFEGLYQQIKPRLSTMATAQWIDLLYILRNETKLLNRQDRQVQIENKIQSRLHVESRRITLSQDNTESGWLMMRSQSMVIGQSILSFMQMADKNSRDPENMARMILAYLELQKNGSWGDSLSNAWGALILRKYASLYEKTSVTGKIQWKVSGVLSEIKSQINPVIIDAKNNQVVNSWAFDPQSARTFQAQYDGKGIPWLQSTLSANAPFLSAVDQGIRVSKTWEPFSVKNNQKKTRGDIWKITLQISTRMDFPWLVVDDPIPPGAQIVSMDAVSFAEKNLLSTQFYWEQSTVGTKTFSYLLRLNQSGQYQLSETRAEAVYNPEIFGAIPNAAMAIEK